MGKEIRKITVQGQSGQKQTNKEVRLYLKKLAKYGDTHL
jgi:hypothetical protein